MNNSTEEQDRHKSIGVFVGTFNPVHFGHLATAQDAIVHQKLEGVLFIPTVKSSHKLGSAIAAYEHRCEMLKLAIHGNDLFEFSNIAQGLRSPTMTFEVLEALRASWGSTIDIFLILGGDMVLDLVYGPWLGGEKILFLVKGIIGAYRSGYELTLEVLAGLEQRLPGLERVLIPIQEPSLSLSATILRQRVAAQLPIRYFTPDSVVDYINTQHLYQEL